MKNSDSLFKQLKAAYFKPDDKIPKGYKSYVQWKMEWKTGKNLTRDLLLKGIEKKIIEKRILRVNQQLVPYYGPPRKNKSTKPKR